MSTTKCICNINGYQIKDKTAREQITTTNTTLSGLQSNVSNISTTLSGCQSQLGELQTTVSTISTNYVKTGDMDIRISADIATLTNQTINPIAQRVTNLENNGVGGGATITYDEANESLTIA